jgi:RNA polymerase sigma-70 factor (ECF subfamily)
MPKGLDGSPIDLDDQDVFLRLARGELGALASLYDRHRLHVYRFVAHCTGPDDDVEDIVQATFLAAARAAKSFDGRRSARPWLFGIASRLVHRRQRTRARLARAMRELAGWLKNVHVDPHRDLAVRDEIAVLDRAFARLTEAKRVVLYLAEVEGLSCEEIAGAIGAPIGTVWTRLHHARRDIRRILRPASRR